MNSKIHPDIIKQNFDGFASMLSDIFPVSHCFYTFIEV
jgi:hypothetical protein